MNHSDDNIKYKHLIEHMNEAVWIGDDKEKTIYANPKFCQLVEMTLDEIIGRESYDFWDKKSVQVVRDVNNTDRKKWISSSYQCCLLSKTGKLIPVLLFGTPLPDGGTIGIMTDLTEIKKNEEKSITLARAIDHSHDAVILTDKKWNILSWNSGAENIFGYRENDILWLSIGSLFGEDSWEIYFSKPFLQKEIQVFHKNKNLIFVDATITRLENNNKEFSYIFIARNISQQIQIQKDMLLRYEKMQQAYNEFWIIRRRMDYIFDLIEEISKRWQSISEIADFIIASLIMLTRANGSALRILKWDKLEMVASFGLWPEWSGKKHIPLKASLAYNGFLKGENVKIFDISLSSEYSTKTLALKNNFSSAFVMPLAFRWVFLWSISLYIYSQKDFHIFENTFLPRYKQVIEVALGTLLDTKKLTEIQ